MDMSINAKDVTKGGKGHKSSTSKFQPNAGNFGTFCAAWSSDLFEPVLHGKVAAPSLPLHGAQKP